MPYSTGTITINNGQSTLTGNGTDWINAGIRPGHMVNFGTFMSTVASVTDGDTLELTLPYQGSNLSAVAYEIIETAAIISNVSSQLMTLINNYQATHDGAGKGKFAHGTVGAPGVRGETDQDTGLAWLTQNFISLIAGGNEQLRLGGGVASGGAVQGSFNDSTLGKLLKVGAFGLGGAAIELTAGDDLDVLAASGFYYNPTGSNTTNNNYPIASAGSLLNIRRSATNWTQKFTSYSGASTAAATRIFERSYGGSGWGPWVETFHQGTILGTVSEASGVPTGRVIERGSNANGEYVRFADGTQICTHFMIADANADVTWTYPASFEIIPKVTGMGNSEDRVAASGSGGQTTTSATFHLWLLSANPARSGAGTNLMAIGRWF